jgi:hypothetical protein
MHILLPRAGGRLIVRAGVLSGHGGIPARHRRNHARAASVIELALGGLDVPLLSAAAAASMILRRPAQAPSSADHLNGAGRDHARAGDARSHAP